MSRISRAMSQGYDLSPAAYERLRKPSRRRLRRLRAGERIVGDAELARMEEAITRGVLAFNSGLAAGGAPAVFTKGFREGMRAGIESEQAARTSWMMYTRFRSLRAWLLRRWLSDARGLVALAWQRELEDSVELALKKVEELQAALDAAYSDAGIRRLRPVPPEGDAS